MPGSSPLTRGTHEWPRPYGCSARLIPAHAGNTGCAPMATSPCWAHPRSRGEHQCVTEALTEITGSSPLTRGTHVRHFSRQRLKRLIPAHAGNTLVCGPSILRRGAHPAHAGNTRHQPVLSRMLGAHPRSRGEHTRIRVRMVVRPGSSPLTRGTR